MALSDIDRARVIMDLVKDGNVANETPYNNVDKIDAPTGLKYVDAFVDVFGPIRDNEGNEVETPTNAQKARFYLNRLKQHHRDVLMTARVPAAATAARETEQSTVATELNNEIGTNEPTA